jgi:hypothetical protein
LEVILAFLVEQVIPFLAEILLQVLFEVALDELIYAPFQTLGRRTRVEKGFLLLMLGVAAGLIFTLLFPNRLVRSWLPRGVSVLVGPLAVGALMEQYGRYRRIGGHTTSAIATWWGGALFAFGVAVIRVWLVRES